ncbi:ankyrin-3-like isoform X2 [Eriocheir sinensis]|uniref:ankyrin-3-like isoform X2 n=1 Tax=Eriocheir sinensis TaxID=95602 RepID=UPI0021C66223|nr:ankyrin-3-like isoform X2 [Eriocheir sinensis]
MAEGGGAPRNPKSLGEMNILVHNFLQSLWGKATKDLVTAVEEGDEVGLREAITRGGNLHAKVPANRGVSMCMMAVAAGNGHGHLLQCLAEAGLNLEGSGSDDCTPLIHAALEGHCRTVKVLLSLGANPQAKSNEGYTALHVAAMWGHVQCVVVLAQVTQRPREGERAVSPVHLAGYGGHVKVMQVLASAGWSLNTKHESGWTAMHQAVLGGHLDMVKFLVENGEDPLVKADNGLSPLELAVIHGRHAVEEWTRKQRGAVLLDITTCLRLLRMRMNWNEDRHRYIMSWMAAGNIAMVLSNIPEHADGHVMDKAGWTPLHRAAQRGLSCRSVCALLDQGINPHVLTPEGMTATDLARRGGHMELLDELSKHSCCKDDSPSMTLYHEVLAIISQGDDVQAVSSLLCQGAPLESVSGGSQSPLKLAVVTNRCQIVTLLLASGAVLPAGLLLEAWQSPDVTSGVLAALTTGLFERELAQLESLEIREKAVSGKETVRQVIELQRFLFCQYTNGGAHSRLYPALGRTALLLASRKGFMQLTYMLLHVGNVPVDDVIDDVCGTTALHQAASHGKDICVAVMLDAGADPLRSDRYGQTPCLLAAMFGHKSTHRLLEVHGSRDPPCRAGTNASQVRRNFNTYLKCYSKFGSEGQRTLTPFDHHDQESVLKKLLQAIPPRRLQQEAEAFAVDFSEGEAKNVQESVMKELHAIIERMGTANANYKGDLRIVGSAQDNSKLFAPDEFDVNLVLSPERVNVKLEKGHKKEMFSETKQEELIKVSVESKDICIENNCLIEGLFEAVKSSLVSHVLHDARLSLVPPGLTRTQVGVALALAWQGELSQEETDKKEENEDLEEGEENVEGAKNSHHRPKKYPLLLVGVDLVPVVKVPWLDEVKQPRLTPQGATHMYLSNTDNGSWRCSFAQTEASVLRNMGGMDHLVALGHLVQLMGKLLLSFLKAEPWMPKHRKTFCTWFVMRAWGISLPSGFCLKNALLRWLDEELRQLDNKQREDGGDQSKEEKHNEALKRESENDPVKVLLQLFRSMCDVPTDKRGRLKARNTPAYFGGECESPKQGFGAPIIVQYLEECLEEEERQGRVGLIET